MNGSALTRARAGDHQAFAALTDPYRRELQLHCYRIVGQVQDAEDAVQETFLSAWSALDSFEERATLAAPSTAAEFSALIAREMAIWAEVVKATGTRPGN